MSSLGDLVGKDVIILTCDGRRYLTSLLLLLHIIVIIIVIIILTIVISILGVLRGFDQVLNVVLERCHERIFSTTQGVVQNVLGLYMIRGDNM
jgi:small nuclear ribonucleoprotein (snRNP)-like protein